jgi:hypothetical protein
MEVHGFEVRLAENASTFLGKRIPRP